MKTTISTRASTCPRALLTPGLSKSIETHQAGNGLREDGFLNPGGPTEQSINNRLLQKPAGAGLLDTAPLKLTGSVGNDRDNHAPDVVAVKKTLGGLGLMAEDPFDNPHPFIDAPTTRGLRAFQKVKKLREDGAAAPGGETERALRGAFSDLAKTFGPIGAPSRSARRRRKGGIQTAEFKAGDEGGVDLAQIRPFPIPPQIFFPKPRPRLPLPVPRPRAPEGAGPSEERRDPQTAAEAIGETLGDLVGKMLGPDRKLPGPPNTKHDQPKIKPGPFTGPNPDKARRKPGSTAHTSPPPKMPTKTVLPQRKPPGLRDSVLINPDQRDELRIPIWVENRKGSPATQKLTSKAGDTMVEIASDVFKGGKVEHYSGGSREERIVPNKDTLDQKPRTNKGGSFPDYTITIDYGGKQFVIHVDTYTARKRTRMRPAQNKSVLSA